MPGLENPGGKSVAADRWFICGSCRLVLVLIRPAEKTQGPYDLWTVPYLFICLRWLFCYQDLLCPFGRSGVVAFSGRLQPGFQGVARAFGMIGIYTNFEQFLEQARQIGVEVDLHALLGLDVLFFEQYEQYTILSLKDYSGAPNNLLILSKERSLLYSEKQITQRDFRLFRQEVKKKYGESTALALLALQEVLKSYSKQFDKSNQEIDSYTGAQDLPRIETTSIELRKLTVRVEDFVNLLYTLEDRKVPMFVTQYISYDYDLLLARARHLLDRCRNHLQELRDLRGEIEIKNTNQLNKRLEELTNIMKKLTALTLILMIPTIVFTVYGMNFTYMPELDHPLGYPIVLVMTGLFTLLAVFLMRRRGYL